MPPIALISLALGGVAEIIKVVNAIRTTAQQNGEWTPEEEAQFKKKLSDTFASPHWKVE